MTEYFENEASTLLPPDEKTSLVSEYAPLTPTCHTRSASSPLQ